MNATHILPRMLVLFVVAGAALCGAANAVGGSPADQIQQGDLLVHLQAFQSIADANGGNRTLQSPGYDASVAYVVDRLQQAGLTPQVQEVMVGNAPIKTGPPTFERTAPTAKTYIEGTDYRQVEPGPDLPIVGQLFVPSGNGCSEGDYAGMTPGEVALITLSQACTPAVAHLAADLAVTPEGDAHPALGVLFAPEDGAGAPLAEVNVAFQQVYRTVPTMTLSGDTAVELETLAESGPVVVHLGTGYTKGPVPTTNVIAEIPGRSDDVVMVGAHLDSVPNGPGMDDNASGAAGVLAVAEHLAAAPQPERTIRFAWWGAEEDDLLGSKAYVDALTPADLHRIVAYLNVDMLGAPNWVRGVNRETDPELASPGSDGLAARFVDYFERLGEPVNSDFAWGGRSDNAPFAAQGIPTSGLATAGGLPEKTAEEAARFGGTAGAPYDPCYHLPCDTIANVDLAIATDMTRALGAVTWDLATETSTAPVPAAPVVVTPAFTG